MATLVLSAVGASLGEATGIPYGATIGRMLGASLGGALGGTTRTSREGPRLETLSVQTSSYGKVIPQMVGRMRLAGNVVWARPLREVATTTTTRSAGKGGVAGGGGRVSESSTTYSYFASVAVAICEGGISAIDRIWADAKLIDPSQYTIRTYLGDEAQNPDPLIEIFQGVGTTPAYRGLAYVVFEDFPLEDYGNRLPNFTFEVRRSRLMAEIDGAPLEHHIHGVTLIPGSGEWVYDTNIQTKRDGVYVGTQFAPGGYEQIINAHAQADRADALVAVDQLQETLPNLQWVSVVVSWFADSLDAGACVIEPGVEYAGGGDTVPNLWRVGAFTRNTARLITYVDGGPQFGGTPDDASLLRLLDDLRSRGYRIALYPLLMVDAPGKPWRGHITGSPGDAASFFTRSHGYNEFVQHYASLVAGRVDAFIIGSELKGLTGVMGAAGVFPAVTQLIGLAASVRGILGSGVKLTYAADWSEYHHTDGGWYHMDALWASPNIDAVGIDAYFPLTDSAEDAADGAAILAGWTSGELYDFYYSDGARTVKAPLSPAYALKNIAWWWGNAHTQPGGGTSAWVPGAKPIWFTELGFPSVDGAANEPNVFYDPASFDGGLPRFSRGGMDIRAQRIGLLASLKQWKDSPMVERIFLWTWDARPYPEWPDRLDVWSDGSLWAYGHWLQGKLNTSHLGALVSDLCLRAGLRPEQIDTSVLDTPVDGFILTEAQSVRQAIESLQAAYFFDLIESGTVLRAQFRKDAPELSVTPDTLLCIGDEEANPGQPALMLTRTQSLELPARVEVQYLSRSRAFDTCLQRASAPFAPEQNALQNDSLNLGLPLCLSDAQSAEISRSTLNQAWRQRTQVALHLPIAACATLEPGDRLTVASDTPLRLRVAKTQLMAGGRLAVDAVEDDPSLYPVGVLSDDAASVPQPLPPNPGTAAMLFDLPAFPGDGAQDLFLSAALSATSAGWRGAELLRDRSGGQAPISLGRSAHSATVGTALGVLAAARACVMDLASSVTVLMRNQAALASVSDEALRDGANAAVLGGEVLQFGHADSLGGGQYRLSRLYRGRLGTEDAIGSHVAGEAFALLDADLLRSPLAVSLLGSPQSYRAVSFGAVMSEVTPQSFTARGRALMPYAPVHLHARMQAGGTIHITWKRRTRLGGEWRDGVDAPLQEQDERYRLDLLDGAGATLRSWTTVMPEADYVAADQTADFGSAPATLTVRVAQLSMLVGAGVARLVTLAVLPEGF